MRKNIMWFFNNKFSVIVDQDSTGCTIHYDAGGVGENWPEDFRSEFETELYQRLMSFDPKIPRYQNGVWNPRRKRLSLPLGEIVTQTKYIYTATMHLIATVMDVEVYNFKSG